MEEEEFDEINEPKANKAGDLMKTFEYINSKVPEGRVKTQIKNSLRKYFQTVSGLNELSLKQYSKQLLRGQDIETSEDEMPEVQEMPEEQRQQYASQEMSTGKNLFSKPKKIAEFLSTKENVRNFSEKAHLSGKELLWYLSTYQFHSLPKAQQSVKNIIDVYDWVSQNLRLETPEQKHVAALRIIQNNVQDINTAAQMFNIQVPYSSSYDYLNDFLQPDDESGKGLKLRKQFSKRGLV